MKYYDPDEAPSLVEMMAEEMQDEFNKQTCDTCGHFRSGCGCPEGECDCDQSWYEITTPRDQW